MVLYVGSSILNFGPCVVTSDTVPIMSDLSTMLSGLNRARSNLRQRDLKIWFQKKKSHLNQIRLQSERGLCSNQQKRGLPWWNEPSGGIVVPVAAIALWSKYNSEWVLLLGLVSSTSPVTSETLTPPPAYPRPLRLAACQSTCQSSSKT